MDAAEYDAWYDTPRGRWIGQIEYRLVAALLAPRPEEHILDVGCGTGWFTRRLAQMDRLRVKGVDIDTNALDFARQHDHLASYETADALHLPFDDGTFDRVMSVTALCFVPNWPHALSEIIRVSRSRFVVGLLNRNSVLWMKKGRKGGTGAYRGAHWHTPREILRALKTLPVTGVSLRTAVLMPSGSFAARCVESMVGDKTSFGSFLVVAGDKADYS
ncbi:MAG: class I SAM-dependent methyltransferase [Gammaproteobacteria bacterium]|nr:class I SAM-dependent methyltransferase [Gammaproteobacteria bacterium]